MKRKIAVAILSLIVIFILASMSFAADNAEKFPLKDVSVEYNSDAAMSVAQGEITNNSGKSYETAIFKLSFYDGDGKLLGAADVAIEDFEAGETVTFEGVGNKNFSKWKSCKIRLELSV